jgi:hypothetical protein
MGGAMHVEAAGESGHEPLGHLVGGERLEWRIVGSVLHQLIGLDHPKHAIAGHQEQPAVLCGDQNSSGNLRLFALLPQCDVIQGRGGLDRYDASQYKKDY